MYASHHHAQLREHVGMQTSMSLTSNPLVADVDAEAAAGIRVAPRGMVWLGDSTRVISREQMTRKPSCFTWEGDSSFEGDRT